MSVFVNIRQNKENPKKIGHKFLAQFAEAENLVYGVPNEAWVFTLYEGKNDIRNQLFMLYDPYRIARGFTFYLDGDCNIEMSLNLPCAEEDIAHFYHAVGALCKSCRVDSFEQEGEPHALSDIPALQEENILFNRRLIHEDIEENLTIFGSIYPIVIEDELYPKLRNSDEASAAKIFGDYLHEKQKDRYYFAKPALYKNDSNGMLNAYYTLTEDTPSIFPLNPHLPYGYNQENRELIENWRVGFAVKSGADYDMLGILDFDKVREIFDFDSCPKFDKAHIIVNAVGERLEKARRLIIENETAKLVSWLGEKKIKTDKIEYVEKHGYVYLFKFKKGFLGKWQLAITGSGGAHSEFKPFNPETAKADADEMLRKLTAE